MEGDDTGVDRGGGKSNIRKVASFSQGSVIAHPQVFYRTGRYFSGFTGRPFNSNSYRMLTNRLAVRSGSIAT